MPVIFWYCRKKRPHLGRGAAISCVCLTGANHIFRVPFGKRRGNPLYR